MLLEFGGNLWNVTIIALVLVLNHMESSKLKDDRKVIGEMLDAREAIRFNPVERRLLNIVAEIALASGVVPPRVHILNDDETINALTVEQNQRKVALIVTSGALRYLTRDELQGVIAHEFSHIRNDDMKLSAKMFLPISIIDVIALIGFNAFITTLDVIIFADDRIFLIIHIFILTVICASFIAVWLMGKACALMIKSAINKEREFLADASAVQFCGHNGIAGAFKKIERLNSTVKARHASKFSYLFFAQAIKSRLFATHPPLAERIKRVDPKWDGQFITPKPLNNYDALNYKRDAYAATIATASVGSVRKNKVKQKVAPIESPDADAKGLTNNQPETQTTDQNTNESEIDLLSIATADIEVIPEYLREQAADPLAARWIIYVLLIDRRDLATALRQHKMIATRVYPDEFEKIATAIDSLKRESVVHLIFLCVPALKNLTIDQYKRFREVADLLIEEDGKVSLFEFNLKYLVFYTLDIAFDLRKSPKIVYNAIEPIAKEISVALSAIVYDQYQNDDKAKSAFDNVCKTNAVLEYIPSNKILTQTLERAYDRIQQSNDEIKQQIIDLAIKSVKSDGVIAPEEAETIHALRSALGLGYM
ncbi:MAG: M48 family metalloprotease [Helicobacteraceae bacterium]|nr:M48 family metalloprotease [Helicobacteraceae bacterium]